MHMPYIDIGKVGVCAAGPRVYYTIRGGGGALTITLNGILVEYQASTLTQNDTGPVGPVTPSIYWSYKMFTGPTFFL